MRPVIYGRSVLGWVCNPLEWLPLGSPDPPSGSASLDPQLGVSGLFNNRSFWGRVFPRPPSDSWALEAQGSYP
jgi:hypothetical protein